MRSTAFRISGIEPRHDNAWFNAGDAVRRMFWRWVRDLVLQAKDLELAHGLDRHGRPMVPIRPYTKAHRKSAMGPADPDAPPLTPAYGLSRTRAFLKGRAHADHAEFYWEQGWGKILGYHRVGAGRLPVRDVIGLAPASLQWVEAQARKRWEDFKRGKAFVEQGKTFGVKVAEPSPRPTSVLLKLVEDLLGVKFKPSPAAVLHKYKTIVVDMARIEADLARDKKFRVGPQGTGAARPGSYEQALAIIQRAKREGKPLEMARLGLDTNGVVTVIDGRHRLAALRDVGAQAVPVSVPPSEAAAIRARYGWTPPAGVRAIPRGATEIKHYTHAEFHTKRPETPAAPAPGDFVTGFYQFGPKPRKKRGN